MFQFYDVIINFLNTVVNFIANLFMMIGTAIAFIVQGVGYVFSIILYLPPWVMPFITAVIAWSVIMFLINR